MIIGKINQTNLDINQFIIDNSDIIDKLHGQIGQFIPGDDYSSVDEYLEAKTIFVIWSLANEQDNFNPESIANQSPYLEICEKYFPAFYIYLNLKRLARKGLVNEVEKGKWTLTDQGKQIKNRYVGF